MTTKAKYETWSPVGMSNVRSRPDFLVAHCIGARAQLPQLRLKYFHSMYFKCVLTNVLGLHLCINAQFTFSSHSHSALAHTLMMDNVLLHCQTLVVLCDYVILLHYIFAAQCYA